MNISPFLVCVSSPQCSIMTSLLDLSYIQHVTGEQLLVTDTSGTPLEVIGNVKWVSKTILLCTSISILST